MEGLKLPPHSLEAEQSVLGGLMLDNERWDNVSERVASNDFFSRPLVLPADAKITLRLSERNRGREVEVSVDGRRWGGLQPGQEVRLWLEELAGDGCEGGIPCVKRLSGPRLSGCDVMGGIECGAI